jgi:ATP adenylyltransferase
MEPRMDQLWAPWRLAYVAAPAPPNTRDCFICAGLAANADRDNLIAVRTPQTVAMLNRFPYNNGHLLVAPRAHKGGLDELDSGELLEVMETLRRTVSILQELMKPDGFNVGLNLGRAAGAGLPGHLHWHIVPRWNGDTNFMPVCAETKVISQSLDSLWEMLSARNQDSGVGFLTPES